MVYVEITILANRKELVTTELFDLDMENEIQFDIDIQIELPF